MSTNYEVILIFPFLPNLEHSKVGFRYQQSPKQFTKFWQIWWQLMNSHKFQCLFQPHAHLFFTQ